jgi:uncharacterized protein YciI
MQFVWLGFLKDHADPGQDVQQATSEFLGQPLIPISAAGALRGDDGRRSGMLMIFEAEDRGAAEGFVGESPFLKAGLYSEHHLFEFQNEIG